jgi:hypothetical protein
MHELTLRLWLNETPDWSIEINGLRYEHIPAEIMEALVEVALIKTEKSLSDMAAQRAQ